MAKLKELVLILDNLRSAHNVGAIFRTAEGAGVSKVYLAGYTPAPLDRFRRPNTTIAKTALGAEKIVPWEAAENILALIKKLKSDGYQIIALEQSPKSIDYRQVKLGEHTALIVGNEVGGIAAEVLNECDTIIEIPMAGQKESLNVSVATGVTLFSLVSGGN